MKSNRIVPAVAGVFVFLSIVLTFVWLSRPGKSELREVALDEAVTKIERREVKEAVFKQSQVEIVDVNGTRFYSNLGSDPTRESLVTTIKDHNKINSAAPIKFTEEAPSSGLGWILLINAVPMIVFFVMWALTLAVIVYAVRTLSRK